jgi:hypothetical protein
VQSFPSIHGEGESAQKAAKITKVEGSGEDHGVRVAAAIAVRGSTSSGPLSFRPFVTFEIFCVKVPVGTAKRGIGTEGAKITKGQ